MNLLRVAVTSLISLAALFLLTKLMGNKQVSQMNLFDYIVGITIGSIAAEMATELDTPENSLLAMAVYAVVAVCISLLTNKSLAARRIMTGKPLILMDGGVIYRDNLKKAKMDLGEFLMYCRIGGYFDLSQIQTALLEHNGKVTFLPVEMQRPATPADFSTQPLPITASWKPAPMGGGATTRMLGCLVPQQSTLLALRISRSMPAAMQAALAPKRSLTSFVPSMMISRSMTSWLLSRA